MVKVIIAGSRGFNDYNRLKSELDMMLKEKVIIVSGHAKGADMLGEQYAKEKGLEVEVHPAKWNDLTVPNCVVKTNSYGKYNALAGMNRNKEMLDSLISNEDGGVLIAFWDGKSSGTKNMIDIASKQGIPSYIVKI